MLRGGAHARHIPVNYLNSTTDKLNQAAVNSVNSKLYEHVLDTGSQDLEISHKSCSGALS